MFFFGQIKFTFAVIFRVISVLTLGFQDMLIFFDYN